MKKIDVSKNVACVVAVLCLVAAAASARPRNYRFSMETYRDESYYLDTNIRYPVFKKYPEIGSAIKAAIFEQYGKCNSASLADNWRQMHDAAGEEPPVFEYTVSCEPVISRGRYISVLARTYFFAGGVHGAAWLNSFTYDTQERRFVTLPELEGCTYEAVSRVCREQLYQRQEELGSTKVWIDRGTEPDDKNFSEFTFDGKTLTIYFQDYQVAPHAGGMPEVRLDISTLAQE